MNRLPSGIIPALMTGFDKDGNFNRKSTYELVKNLVSRGVSGFYVGGSSGEMLQMSASERMELTETAVEAVKDTGTDCPIIVQVGGIAKDAVKIAKHAEKSGASAVSSMTPLYYKFSFNEVEDYYKSLGTSVGIPLVMYNIPILSGVSFDFSQLERLMSPDYVGGIKFTANDFFTFERVRQCFPEKIMYSGFDEMFLSGLAMGADGAIGTTYNFMPEIFIEMRKEFLSGNVKKALELQHSANSVIYDMMKVGVLPATKAIISSLGIDIGNCRPPFSLLSDDAKEFAVKSYNSNILNI